MRTNLSKKLLAALLSLAMVLSLVGIQPSSANAAAKYSINKGTTTTAGKSTTLKVKGVSKSQYVKVWFNKEKVSIKSGSKKLTNAKTKVKGTGKTLSLKVTTKETGADYGFKVTVKVYNKKNKVVKTLVSDKNKVKTTVKEEPTEEPTEAPTEEPTEAPTTATLPEITGVKAVKVDTVEVTFAAAVTAEDVVITVARGANAVTLASTKWNEDKTVATLTTDAKMINGKHTVTAKSASLDKEVTGSYEVESQKVTEIVIKNETALTNADKTEAYVYYDVLDQYGESVRSTTSITWTTSTNGNTGKDTNAGKLTLRKKTSSDTADTFSYNEQIYLTGVYEKNGVTVSSVVKVGMEQSLDSIKIAGFVKKNTNKLVENLPVNFKTGDYRIAFTLLDQNGNELEPSAATVGTDVTFISENVLVIDQNFTAGTPVVINGTEYATATIKPGSKVSDGGEVAIKAIATKTGTTTTFYVVVGEDIKLTSFTMSEPAKIVVEGETVTIPFTALDQNGNEIKSFDAIAKAKTYNELSISSSQTVWLESDDDGKAVLKFRTTNTHKMDGVDLPVVINTVVTMGTGSSLTLSVQDPAVPVGIKGISQSFNDGGMYDTLATTVAETAPIFLNVDKLSYVDQYGRTMVDYVGENLAETHNFFGRAYGTGHTTDFNNYTYYVKAEYIGSGEIQYTTDDAATTTSLVKGDYFLMSASGSSLVAVSGGAVRAWNGADDDNCYLLSKNDVEKVATGENFKFSIVKTKKADCSDLEGVSTTKTIEFKVVDMSVLNGLTLAPWYDTVKLTTAYSHDAMLTTDVSASPVTASVIAANDFSVYGYYDGAKVYVPSSLVSVTGNYLENNAGVLQLTTTGSVLKWGDLYDYTQSKAVRKAPVTDRLVATISNVVATGSAWTTKAAASIKISDAASYAKEIVVGGDKVVNTSNTALSTVVTNDTTPLAHENNWVMYYFDEWFIVLDQYGLPMDSADYDVYYTVKNIVENPEGRTENNFKVTSNGTALASISGAELGDKYDLEISIFSKNTKSTVTETVSMTVGADSEAYIAAGHNYYHGLLDLIDRQAN